MSHNIVAYLTPSKVTQSIILMQDHFGSLHLHFNVFVHFPISDPKVSKDPAYSCEEYNVRFASIYGEPLFLGSFRGCY